LRTGLRRCCRWWERSTPLPGSGQRVLSLADAASNARVIFGAGNLSSELTDLVTVDTRNTATFVSGGAARLRVRITPQTGLFSGSFLHPATRKAVRFNGAVAAEPELRFWLVPGAEHQRLRDVRACAA